MDIRNVLRAALFSKISNNIFKIILGEFSTKPNNINTISYLIILKIYLELKDINFRTIVQYTLKLNFFCQSFCLIIQDKKGDFNRNQRKIKHRQWLYFSLKIRLHKNFYRNRPNVCLKYASNLLSVWLPTIRRFSVDFYGYDLRHY